MSRSVWAAALFVASALGIAAGSHAQRKTARTAKTAPKKEIVVTPRQENQFVTVDEFVKARRSAGTAVSVEGYAVIGMKNGSGIKLAIVDSVDHVLNAADANNFAAGGAYATIPGSAVAKRATWGMTPKGLARFTMYTGTNMAQRELHDVVAKLRITGRSSGRTINVTGVEYMDDNGDWKKL